MSPYASYCQDQGIDCARRARLARSLEVATYWRCLGFRWLRLAEQAQRTGGALGRASQEVSNLDLERETTHARANATREVYRRILTNDPVEAPFCQQIVSEGRRHMHEAIRSGWRPTPAQCPSSAMGRFVSMPHTAHT